MTKPKKSTTVIGRDLEELDRLSKIPGSGVTATVYDASKPVDLGKIVAAAAGLCGCCGHPVKADACAVCGNKP